MICTLQFYTLVVIYLFIYLFYLFIYQCIFLFYLFINSYVTLLSRAASTSLLFLKLSFDNQIIIVFFPIFILFQAFLT